MNNHPSMPAHAGDHPEDVELFCLELDHQIQTAIKPAIRAELDCKQSIFDATIKCLAKPAPKQAGRQRHNRRHKGNGAKAKRVHPNRSTRRRQKRKPPFVRDLAARLAGHWKAPLVIDPRLKAAG